jgi:hypothetical protein
LKTTSCIIFSAIFFTIVLSFCASGETVLRKIDMANIAVECPDEILIEKGWTNYASFSVNNTGDTDIYGTIITVKGNSNWFELQNSSAKIISKNEKLSFIAKLLVPYEAPTGSYRFTFKMDSDEISFEKDFYVRVFSNRDDMLLYQLENLKGRLEEIEIEANKAESDKVNLTFARSLIIQANNEIRLAQEDVSNKIYTQVTEYIRDVEKLIIKANFEVTNPPPVMETKKTQEINVSPEAVLLYAPMAILAFIAILLIYLITKVKIQNSVRLPNLKLKEAVVENKKLAGMDNEIGKIVESQKLLDEEFRQNVISKESYDDLKSKYQEKLLELETEKRRARGY